ncbi:ADP-glyceromanno-heptose 6-epimerase [Saprospiraceae bacterium]|nr:ADP-glyceromanno-heptose 6-epimerase [Saprospiraceae bacterium]MDC1508189.1 ADP-glyceromanno-heptose 6-epimerase [Saprospiraceae bacterium]
MTKSKKSNILITGAAGFIPSCLAHRLFNEGHDLILVDNFHFPEKNKNLEGLSSCKRIERDDLFTWIEENEPAIDFVFHLGARTDTTETKKYIFDKLNVEYSQDIWRYCTLEDIPLIYASSAATYGLGEYGFVDDHEIVNSLKPLNAYGDSKNNFDKWALKEFMSPSAWYGFKFFNVFGPNEYHKGRMASVVFHFYNQLIKTGEVNLFKSHKNDYKNGEQTRDFIYVDDLINVMLHFHDNEGETNNGLYNIGTGNARTYNDLAKAIFKAVGKDPVINYIDTPEDIREKYQYFTEADMTKVKSAGYEKAFMSLEETVAHYVNEYLAKGNKVYTGE